MVAKKGGKLGGGRKAGKAYTKDDKGRGERFVDFGQKRVSKAIKAVRQIGNLSNKQSYHYTDEQVTRMFNALAEAHNAAKAKFSAKGKEKGEEFSF